MSLTIKIIGCILLIAASTLLGFKKSNKLHRRKELISIFLVFLDSLSTNIRYSTDELSVMLSKCEDSFGRMIYNSYKETNGSFFNRWKQAVLSVSNAFSPKYEDKQLLCSFGERLGLTDVEGQLKHIELYKSLAKAHLDDCNKDIAEKSRLYRTMGFFAGTAAALIII